MAQFSLYLLFLFQKINMSKNFIWHMHWSNVNINISLPLILIVSTHSSLLTFSHMGLPIVLPFIYFKFFSKIIFHDYSKKI